MLHWSTVICLVVTVWFVHRFLHHMCKQTPAEKYSQELFNNCMSAFFCLLTILFSWLAYFIYW